MTVPASRSETPRVEQVQFELAAILALAVLRLRRRAIDAAPAGEAAPGPPAGIPSDSSQLGLEVCAPSRPCGPTTRVDSVGALGEAHASPTTRGVE